MGGCCCCCQKKKPQPVGVVAQAPKEEKAFIDVGALIRKYAHLITEWVVQENEKDIMRVIGEGFSPDLVFDAGGYDTTILILTIAFKKDNLTKKVLTVHQNLDVVVRPNNDSALIMAISHRNIQILQILVSKGASRSIKGPEGKSPIELADKQLAQCQKIEDQEGISRISQIKHILSSQ